MKSKLADAGLVYDKKRQGLYTDLDTLYDTRLAVVEEVHLPWALQLAATTWGTRLYDKAFPIPDDKYAELYEARDISTLLLASPTMAVDGILGWAMQVRNAMVGTPYAGFVEVFLNVWPYKLSKDQAGVYARKLSSSLGGGEVAIVTLINVDPKEITCMDAKALFSAMFVSDWCYWLEERARVGEIKNTPLPDVSLYAPRLFRGSVTPGEYEMIRDKDIFSTVEQHMAPILGLEFIDTSFFSTIMSKQTAFEGLQKLSQAPK